MRARGGSGGIIYVKRELNMNSIVLFCFYGEIKGEKKSFFPLFSPPPPLIFQPKRENTVNIKSIINIYNLHILKMLSINTDVRRRGGGDKLRASRLVRI